MLESRAKKVAVRDLKGYKNFFIEDFNQRDCFTSN